MVLIFVLCPFVDCNWCCMVEFTVGGLSTNKLLAFTWIASLALLLWLVWSLHGIDDSPEEEDDEMEEVCESTDADGYRFLFTFTLLVVIVVLVLVLIALPLAFFKSGFGVIVAVATGGAGDLLRNFSLKRRGKVVVRVSDDDMRLVMLI